MIAYTGALFGAPCHVHLVLWKSNGLKVTVFYLSLGKSKPGTEGVPQPEKQGPHQPQPIAQVR